MFSILFFFLIASSIILSTAIYNKLWQLETYLVGEYILANCDYLESRRFGSISIDELHRFV